MFDRHVRQATKALTSILLFTLAGCAGSPVVPDKQTPGAARAPLLDGLGEYHRAIATRSPLAQRYFDQGLRLLFAFNYDEAARSFGEAARLDPACVMCAWGEAFALGPYLNVAIRQMPGAVQAARHAAELAADHGTPLEKQLTAALVERVADPPPENRQRLNDAYAAAMKPVAAAYPDDADVQHLYIEALMMTAPVNWWLGSWKPDGTPGRELTRVVLAAVEEALRRSPDHPGLNHLFIHVVEGSRLARPKAIRSAELLTTAMPAAGHLVHMPSHIFMRVGRLAEAEQANRRAVAADRAYLRAHNPGGFYPMMVHHNEMTLWAVLIMRGEGAEAIEVAGHLVAQASAIMANVPEQFRSLAHGALLMNQLVTLVRFARWSDILALPVPGADLLLAQLADRWARGSALAATGKPAEALGELEALERLLSSVPSAGPWQMVKPVLAIMHYQLVGRIALARGDKAGAIAAFEKAVGAEDELDANDEPPIWNLPSRHLLGAALLAAGRAREAEAVYRKDLEILPETCWGLAGLAAALAAEKSPEADQVRRRFEAASQAADVTITSSVL